MTSYENLSYQPYDFNSGQDFIRLTPDVRVPTERNRVTTYEISNTAHLIRLLTYSSFAAGQGAQELMNNIGTGHSLAGHSLAAYRAQELMNNIGVGHSLAGYDAYRIARHFDQVNSEQFRINWNNSMNYSRIHRYTDFLGNGRNTTDFRVSNGPTSVVPNVIRTDLPTGNLYNVGRNLLRPSQNFNQENNLRQEDNLNQDNNLNEESNIMNEEATLNEESNIDEEVMGTVRKRKRIS